MHIKITVEVWEPGREVAEAVLVLKGELVQAVRLSQWLEQTISRLCKMVMPKLIEPESVLRIKGLID